MKILEHDHTCNALEESTCKNEEERKIWEAGAFERNYLPIFPKTVCGHSYV
jgi:hypothetical protein